MACGCVWRSVGEVPEGVAFDCGLLDDAELLCPGEIELNDLTLETIQHKSENTTRADGLHVFISCFLL